MAKLTVKQIRELAKTIVQQSAGGIRYADLVARIADEHPETPRNTIHGSVWNLDRHFPDLIHKPSRGLFVSVSATLLDNQLISEVRPPAEEEFYAPFTDWLKNELDEVTVAIPMGGAAFQKKWGTPDVIGVYRPLASHRIKFPPRNCFRRD